MSSDRHLGASLAGWDHVGWQDDERLPHRPEGPRRQSVQTQILPETVQPTGWRSGMGNFTGALRGPQNGQETESLLPRMQRQQATKRSQEIRKPHDRARISVSSARRSRRSTGEGNDDRGGKAAFPITVRQIQNEHCHTIQSAAGCASAAGIRSSSAYAD